MHIKSNRENNSNNKLMGPFTWHGVIILKKFKKFMSKFMIVVSSILIYMKYLKY